MKAPDPVRVARALFEAYADRDTATMLSLTHEEVALGSTAMGRISGHAGVLAAFTDEVEATAHAFEAVPPEHVLVTGRLRVIRAGLADSPAWWLLRIRDGLWVSGQAFRTEAAARAAVPVAV